MSSEWTTCSDCGSQKAQCSNCGRIVAGKRILYQCHPNQVDPRLVYPLRFSMSLSRWLYSTREPAIVIQIGTNLHWYKPYISIRIKNDVFWAGWSPSP